jgi:hypothetical protein
MDSDYLKLTDNFKTIDKCEYDSPTYESKAELLDWT